jgi:hypothetical protein
MVDRMFPYWTTAGKRREVPITYFQVPAGEKLEALHNCPQSRSGDNGQIRSPTSDMGPPLVTVLQQTESVHRIGDSRQRGTIYRAQCVGSLIAPKAQEK